MTQKVNFTIRDFSLENTTTGIFIDDVSTNGVTLQALIDAVTIGVIAQRTEIAAVVNVSAAVPESKFAQRELGLRIYYTDDVTEKSGSFTIGCPALEALSLVGDSVVLEDESVMAALVTALNDYGRSADDNNITVNAARIIGRNT